VTLREDMESRRFIEYERRLNRMEAWTRGHGDTDSDRITAVVDEIDGLRKELAELESKVTVMGEWIKKKLGGSNGKQADG
jgi:uncharacterized protein HemX